MDESLRINIRKRGTIKQRLTNFVKFVENIQQQVDSSENIQSIQGDIECACADDDLNEHFSYRDEFNDTLVANQAKALVILETFKNKDNNESSIRDKSELDKEGDNNSIISDTDRDSINLNNVVGNNDRSKVVKLPTIELPKFKGDYSDWLGFKDTFQSLIHDNVRLNKIQKFHYLRASLGQNAQKIIQCLEFSSENYDKAWDLLCKRYNKSQLLVHSHLKALFQIESLGKETACGLRTIIDSVCEHLHALNSLKQPTEQWDQILIYLITNKLDRATLREWDQVKAIDEFPNFQEFLLFLNKRADALETFETNHLKNKDEKENRIIHYKRTSMLASTNLTCNYCPRVVFDGSATTTTGWSLNDLQYTGPSIINGIFKILITIRQYKFLVTADVAKMYRQIWIHPDDRCLQKIFWRNNENEEPRLYTLNTVTYGTSSAPFLAIRCLQQAAYENQHIFPEASQVILDNFYVDDLITGFNSEHDAVRICQQVSYVLNKYNFELRKWHSNNKTITDTNKWYHVSSADNPADIASGGISTQAIITTQLWWKGAPFLALPKSE
ncbi:Reverse transcriptase (RNA-dependent DNA polymerase) [Popillia japonica]|uniref:Reverse transcriptase (RNA-dependent DNA polymerase) n=1 Tax=Popillia japonica TaxID=7064 RepID=A0AAW1K407_POPJA